MKKTVLVVDDTSENIDLLNEILSPYYNIKVATNGILAIKIALKFIPDLILLDIMMPKLDGYDVCKHLKEEPFTKDIPIIFVTAKTELKDQKKGFLTGAVDYITKPFDADIVKLRVKNQLDLKESKDNLKVVLNQTLSGSIKVLTEIMSILTPDIFEKSLNIKKHVLNIVKFFKLKDSWQYELAAMLSLTGYITLPDITMSKLKKGIKLNFSEKQAIKKTPKIGASLISNIPKLKEISEMISLQNRSFLTYPTVPKQSEKHIFLGGQILMVAIDFEELLSKGISRNVALKKLKQSKNIYNEKILEALEEIIDMPEIEMEVKFLSIKNLKIDMIFQEDVKTAETVLVKKGTTLTLPLLKKLQQYSEITKINEPVCVLIQKK